MAYAWHARHGLTAAQFQVEFNSMVSQGFRLIDISGYGVGESIFIQLSGSSPQVLSGRRIKVYYPLIINPSSLP
ncbi:hypothetical protein AAHB57_29965 [Bacillus cereus]